MIISIKDAAKLFILSVMSCCSVFVCTLFLNYQSDLIAVESQITEKMSVIYDALKSTSIVVCAVSGGCLLITSMIMMIFYVKHYIDVHKKELGILKALGTPRMKIARSFWVFGISVLTGTGIGFGSAFAMMPLFYETQNKDHLIPDVEMNFHAELIFYLVILPAVFFGISAIFYAYLKLKAPVLALIKDNFNSKRKSKKIKIENNSDFLKSLRSTTVKSRKSLIFFIIFSGFCYGAMTQMSFSMKDLSSEMMGAMMLIIGLALAFVTLFLAVTTVINANTKTIAMMRVFGYSQSDCRKTILDGYRPLSYIGFAIGTVYQYVLLRIMVDIIFADYEGIPEYEFDFPAMLVSLATFVIIYEAIVLFYSRKIKQISIKEIMLECRIAVCDTSEQRAINQVKNMNNSEWIHCPLCKGKTHTKIRADTVLDNFPLFCPKCKHETLIKAENLNIVIIKEPDAQTQSR